MGEVEFELSELEKDYKAWVSAYLNLWPGRPSEAAQDLKRQLSLLEGVAKPVDVAKPPQADVIKKWASRGSIPSYKNWQEALIRGIKESVPERPKNLMTPNTFRDILHQILQLRDVAGLGDEQKKAYELLFDREVVLFPPKSIKSINLEEIGLGASVLDGAISEYVSRTVDDSLAGRIEDYSETLIILAGETKSGKTRTLVECLRASSRRLNDIFWVSSNEGSVEELIKTLKKLPPRDRVIFLDDIQRFRLSASSSGMNRASLRQLRELGLVVGTIDSRTVEMWLASNLAAGQSLSPSFQEAVASSATYLEHRLNPEELEVALRLFNDRFSEFELTTLAAFLAAGDFLYEKYVSLKNKDLFARSFCLAMVDAYILYPQGVKVQELAELTSLRSNQTMPNAVWNESSFQDEIYAATTGINPGSPHAVLMKSAEAADAFQLMDYVWDKLQVLAWQLPDISALDIPIKAAAFRAFGLGLKKEASELIDSIMSANPPDPDVLGLRGEIALEEKDFQLATHLFSQCIEVFKSNPRAYFLLAETLRLSHRLKDAKDVLERASQIFIENIDFRLELILILISLRDFDVAIELGAGIELSRAKPHAEVLNVRGVILGKAGREVEAEELFREAFELSPKDCFIAANLIYALNFLDRAVEARDFGEEHRAICHYKCSMRGAFGNALVNLGEFDLAREEFDAMLRQDRGDYDAHFGLGMLATRLGEINLSASHFQQSINSASPVCPPLLNLANAQFALGDLESSEDNYLKAIGHNPMEASAINGLGRIALNRGQNKVAKNHFQRALAIEDLGIYRLNVGLACYLLGNFKSAERHLRIGIRASTNAANIDLLDGTLQTFASVLEKNGKIKESIEIHKRIMSQSREPEVLYKLASLLWAEDEITSALEIVRDFFESNPNLAWAHVVWADYLVKADRADEAIVVLQRAARKFESTPYSLLIKGYAWLGLKELLKAAEAFKECLRLDKSHLRAAAMAHATLHKLKLTLKKGEELEELEEYFIDVKSELYCELSVAHALLGNLSEGLTWCKRALDLDPEDSVLLANLGTALINAELPLEGEKYLGNALSKNPSNYTALFVLASSLLERGLPLEALDISRDLVSRSGISKIQLRELKELFSIRGLILLESPVESSKPKPSSSAEWVDIESKPEVALNPGARRGKGMRTRGPQEHLGKTEVGKGMQPRVPKTQAATGEITPKTV